jgi:hypothetical protein
VKSPGELQQGAFSVHSSAAAAFLLWVLTSPSLCRNHHHRLRIVTCGAKRNTNTYFEIDYSTRWSHSNILYDINNISIIMTGHFFIGGGGGGDGGSQNNTKEGEASG